MVKKNKKSMQVDNKNIANYKDYLQVLAELKHKVQCAQLKAALAANRELIRLYWEIGGMIAQKQAVNGWGSGVIENLAEDLQKLLPEISGFSRANIFRMQAFYAAYEKVAQPVRLLEELPIFNIPWGHNVLIMQKIKDVDKRLWYAQRAAENGWSRNALESWIKADLFKREGKAITNFKNTLPDPHSGMAHETLKDPYIFDFLTLHDDHVEQDIEHGLIGNIQKLLLELGKGFAFIGRQYHLVVSGNDYYIDLLFYNLKLRCYVVIELKARKFDPRDTGQLNFYLSVVDDQLKHKEDNPTIGILLCKTKDDIIAEYALRGVNRPIGVARYETDIINQLPKELKSSLPTIEEIEAELEKYEAIDRKSDPKSHLR